MSVPIHVLTFTPRGAGTLKRVGFAMAAVAAVLGGAIGCKSKPGDSGAGSDHGSAGSALHASGADHGSDTRVAVSPTSALVKDAFSGNVPAFPLLASDGSAVAISVESPIGRSAISTYSVSFFSNWTGMTDAWGSSTNCCVACPEAGLVAARLAVRR